MKSLLTYADLLLLEWALEDKIADWEWRAEGENPRPCYDKQRATLARVRQMIAEYPDDLEE